MKKIPDELDPLATDPAADEPPPAEKGDPGNPGLGPNDPPEDPLVTDPEHAEALEAAAAEAVKSKLEYALEKEDREDLRQWVKAHKEVIDSGINRHALASELLFHALRDKNLSKRDVLVLWCIIDRARQSWISWPSAEEIVDRIRLSKSPILEKLRLHASKTHVSDSITKLTTHGYVVRTDGHKIGPRWGKDTKTGKFGLFLGRDRGSVFTSGKAGFATLAELVAASRDFNEVDDDEGLEVEAEVPEDGNLQGDHVEDVEVPGDGNFKNLKFPGTGTSRASEVPGDGNTREVPLPLKVNATAIQTLPKDATAPRGEPLKGRSPEDPNASARHPGRDYRKEEGAAVVVEATDLTLPLPISPGTVLVRTPKAKPPLLPVVNDDGEIIVGVDPARAEKELVAFGYKREAVAPHVFNALMTCMTDTLLRCVLEWQQHQEIAARTGEPADDQDKADRLRARKVLNRGTPSRWFHFGWKPRLREDLANVASKAVANGAAALPSPGDPGKAAHPDSEYITMIGKTKVTYGVARGIVGKSHGFFTVEEVVESMRTNTSRVTYADFEKHLLDQVDRWRAAKRRHDAVDWDAWIRSEKPSDPNCEKWRARVMGDIDRFNSRRVEVRGGSRDFPDALMYYTWHKEHGEALKARLAELRVVREKDFAIFGKRILAAGESITGAEFLALLVDVYGEDRILNNRGELALSFMLEPVVGQIARENPDVALLPLVRAHFVWVAGGRVGPKPEAAAAPADEQAWVEF